MAHNILPKAPLPRLRLKKPRSDFDEMPLDPDIGESEAHATDGESMHDNHFGTHYSWHAFFLFIRL